MEKKIYTAVVIFISSVLLLAFFFPAEKKVYNLSEQSFTAKSSTTLYFKNTRAFYYALEEMPEAGFNLYRFGETAKVDTGLYLNFMLVHNWRADEVYVVTEPSQALLSLGKITVQLGDTLLSYEKTSMNNEAQYDFAAQVFMAMLENKPVLIDGEKSLFGSLENQNANFTVLEDYFKWVYKYR